MLWVLYLVMWVGGIGSYLILGGVRPGDEYAAPLFLAIAGVIVLLSTGRRAAPALLFAGMLGFVAEWIGLTGGWLFGRYVYTDVLAPSALGVPLVMASAWLVLAAYVHSLLAPLRLPGPLAVAAGAALLTAVDLVIDPLAAGPLGYWRWLDGGAFHGVPVHNFAGWFGTSAVILAVLRLTSAELFEMPAARAIGLSIVLFFTVLAAGFGLTVPAATGAGLTLLHVLLTRRPVALLHRHDRAEAAAR
jgi:uncharacterized membrane protein